MPEVQPTTHLDTFTVWRQNITPKLNRVEDQRRESLEAAFHGLPDATYVINTSKSEKALAQLALIQDYIGVPLLLNQGAFLFENPDQSEIKSPRALEVAQWKARQVLSYQRGIQGETRGEIIAAGADVNAFIRVGGIEVQTHKYSRLSSELLRVNRESVQKRIIDGYSKPVNGEVGVRWDLGMHIINGTNHQAGDEIEIVSDPIDRELMTQALNEAEANGLFLSSNLHFAAIESLRENGKIRSVAFLPQALKQQGVTFEDVRQTPTEGLLDQAQHSIVANVPVRYQ